MRWLLIATGMFATLASCAGPSTIRAGGSGAGGAVANLIIGATAAGISRANGGCYAACPTGTSCDGESGFCVPLPCRGQCDGDEHCDQITNACVKGPAVEVGVKKDQTPVSNDYWNAAQPPP